MLLKASMRLLGIVVALGVVLYMYKQRLEPGKDSVDSAMVEFDKTAPAPSGTPAKTAAAPTSTQAPAPASSNLRRPVDRTRAVLEQVKQRNGDGEF
jgi:hypothetical protein